MFLLPSQTYMEEYVADTQQYRKKDPEDSEEVEFMENIFNCLCSILAEPEMKAAFLEAEGVELMVIMMKWVVSPTTSCGLFHLRAVAD